MSPSRAKARATGSGRKTQRPSWREWQRRSTTIFQPSSTDQGEGGRTRPRSSRSTRGSTPGRRSSPQRRRRGRRDASSRASVQEGRALERLHRDDEGGRREGELAVARGQDPGARGDDRGLSRSSEVGRDGRQRVQPDPHHPAEQLRGRRRAGRAVRDDEALAGSDRAAAQEGGGRRIGRRRRSRCTLRVANLFLEKFSNQAEAIKAYEAILELDPDNSEALGFVKQMYEKRRDWEKLIAVNQREIDKLDRRRASARRRRIEVAKLASEKMKKAVGLDRAVAEGARGRRREPRGARRAREAVRAREGVERARRGAGAAGGRDRATPRASPRST